jgi:hypothetical protein
MAAKQVALARVAVEIAGSMIESKEADKAVKVEEADDSGRKALDATQ